MFESSTCPSSTISRSATSPRPRSVGGAAADGDVHAGSASSLDGRRADRAFCSWRNCLGQADRRTCSPGGARRNPGASCEIAPIIRPARRVPGRAPLPLRSTRARRMRSRSRPPPRRQGAERALSCSRDPKRSLPSASSKDSSSARKTAPRGKNVTGLEIVNLHAD